MPIARIISTHLFLALRIAAIVAFVILTNSGFVQRVVLLADQARFGTLAAFLGIWGLSLAAILAAAFQRNTALRVVFACVIALTTAIGFAYHRASGNEFGVFDALSLWNARHEASRAMEFYARDFLWLPLIFLAGVAVLALPPVPRLTHARTMAALFALLPAVPVAAITGIILTKEGGGAQVLPSQFTPLSVGLVVGSKIAAHPLPQRSSVAWTWRGPFAVAAPRSETVAPAMATSGKPAVKHIVMLVDESVRADYIDWAPGNPFTPVLASHRADIVNFGPAASGGNCSHYSNAILRFVAARDRLGPDLLKNPTIWQYAKKAGFRTVYIDAQAGFNRNPGKLQNFMTSDEAAQIDAFRTIDEDVLPSDADDRLLDIIAKEMKSDVPVFIYANKNGAHFPYDRGYPATAKIDKPSMSDGPDQAQGRINSFRNVIRWSVDRLFQRLFAELPLADSVVIYTSDHGQIFDPRRLTHCTVDDPDPREGLVPLFVLPGNTGLRPRFEAAAEASRGHGSHFAIMPAVLELFGYAQADVAAQHEESLLEPNKRAPGFTSGDIFGLFAKTARWHALDLSRDYLEPAARTGDLRSEAARRTGTTGAVTR